MSASISGRISVVRNRFFVMGAASLAICAIGAFYSTREFFVSYWFGYLFWLGLALGCMVITMIHHLTGGRWGHPIRRFTEAGFGTLPLMGLLFLPLFAGLRYLYPWARPEEALASEVFRRKQTYLSSEFYIVRALIYFMSWLVLAWRLRHWSLLQDETKDLEPNRRLIRLSGPGLVILPLTATFAYVDWIMSMETQWYSTIFAIIVLAGQVLAAYAFAVIVLKLFEDVAPIASITRKVHFHQLGNLLLTFVLFWTYVAFAQLLIIYSANLPSETSWYRHRMEGGWIYVIIVIGLFHFFLPFFLLLFRVVKRSSTYLASLAAMLLMMHLLYTYWMITPSVFQDGLHLNWMNFTAPLGIGGIWLGTFLRALQRAPLVPRNDPRMQQEITHAGH